MKFPRIIQPNPSGGRPFMPACSVGEWAVTGAFRFAHRDPATIHGRELEAFRHGWLGLKSFGTGALVEVAELDDTVHEELARRLAAYLMTQHGLDPGPAVAAAMEELAFAESLCDHPPKTVLALDREFNEQGLIERTRIVT